MSLFENKASRPTGITLNMTYTTGGLERFIGWLGTSIPARKTSTSSLL